MGAGTAFHLAARGANNILLLEKKEFFGTDSPWMGQIGKTAGDTIPIKSPESR